MTRPICAIIGIGPGNGQAFARIFHKHGYHVALCSRHHTSMRHLTDELEHSTPFLLDATNTDSIPHLFDDIQTTLGPIQTLIYNAGAGAFANIDDATLEDVDNALDINVRGLFACVQAALPQLRAQTPSNIIVIGATASLRGSANFLPFATAKAAQRNMCQSLARYLSPESIHVSYVIIDGVIERPQSLQWMPNRPRDLFLQPEDIAQSVYFLSQQPRSAWTFELDVRPHIESW